MAFGEGALWVADAVNDAVIELDPTAGLVKRRMPLPLKPTSLIVDGETLWVADYANAEVAQVDTSSGQIVARLHVGGGPTALALGSDALWVVNSLDSTVSRIDDKVSVVFYIYDLAKEFAVFVCVLSHLPVEKQIGEVVFT
jgi:streptogramin lyase